MRLRALKRPHNLPAAISTFVGRDREIAEVTGLVSSARLVTLTGGGGVGKTRLALRAATDLMDAPAAGPEPAFEDGAWWVELAALTDPSLVESTVALALGVREASERPLLDALGETLRPRDTLLILDNCEHLLDAIARIAAGLLLAAPRLRILATSREALGITGEVAWPVPPLSVPGAGRDGGGSAGSHARDVLESEAGRLFVERAGAVRAGFELTEQNAAAVAEICRQLDGIPLAVELAAARVAHLTPEQLAARLDDRLGLLAGRDRTAPPRHRTLRALIDWSHDPLSKPERTLFRRLAAFARGWTLPAAEVVCADGAAGGRGQATFPPSYLLLADEVPALMASLVDKSLVLREDQGDDARYRLLETIRQYAAVKLEESGEERAVQDRHRGWFLALAEQAEPHLRGPRPEAWLARLEREHDNLRTAMGRAVEHGEWQEGLRFGASLWRFWSARGYLAEGRQWLARLLTPAEAAGAGLDTARAGALVGAGRLAWEQGDYAAAASPLEEALAIARRVGHEALVATALTQLGHAARSRGDDAAAGGFYEEALVLGRQLGDRAVLATLLGSLGHLALSRADLTAARALYEECLATVRELGDRRDAMNALHKLGEIAHDQGEYLVACKQYGESLAIARERGDRRGIAYGLEGFAGLAVARGRAARGLRLAGAAAALREAIGAPAEPRSRARFERRFGLAGQALAEEDGAELMAEGRRLGLEAAIAEALAEARTDYEPDASAAD